MKKSNVKKIISLLLCAVMIYSFPALSSAEDKRSDSAKNTTRQELIDKIKSDNEDDDKYRLILCIDNVKADYLHPCEAFTDYLKENADKYEKISDYIYDGKVLGVFDDNAYLDLDSGEIKAKGGISNYIIAEALAEVYVNDRGLKNIGVIIEALKYVPGVSSVEYCGRRTIKEGDADGDGRVTAKDARICLRYSARLEYLERQTLNFLDVNSDGIVNSQDAYIILRVSAGLEKMPK